MEVKFYQVQRHFMIYNYFASPYFINTTYRLTEYPAKIYVRGSKNQYRKAIFSIFSDRNLQLNKTQIAIFLKAFKSSKFSKRYFCVIIDGLNTNI